MKAIDLAAWLKSDNDGDNTPIDNIAQVMSFAANYSTTKGLLDAVDAILDHKKSSARLKNVVEVSTIHRYKGREAAVVYMPGLVHGAFPLSKGDLLEERRLFYVGVTRAMDELWVSYPEFGVEDRKNEPSLFIIEAGLKLADTFEPGRKIQPVKVGTQMGLLI
jgi:DNA helicase-2/ATP-dependent DNA helicase PcrA